MTVNGADGQPFRPLLSGGESLPEHRNRPAIRLGEHNDLRPPHPKAGGDVAAAVNDHAARLDDHEHRLGALEGQAPAMPEGETA